MPAVQIKHYLAVNVTLAVCDLSKTGKKYPTLYSVLPLSHSFNPPCCPHWLVSLLSSPSLVLSGKRSFCYFFISLQFGPHFTFASIIPRITSSKSIFSYVHRFSLLCVCLPHHPFALSPASFSLSFLVSSCLLPLGGVAVLPECSAVTIDSSKCHSAPPQFCVSATEQLHQQSKQQHLHTNTGTGRTWSAAPARSHLSLYTHLAACAPEMLSAKWMLPVAQRAKQWTTYLLNIHTVNIPLQAFCKQFPMA